LDKAVELWSGTAGATALHQVQFLASTASESTSAMDESQFSLAARQRKRMRRSSEQRTGNNRFPPQSATEDRESPPDSNSKPAGESGGVFNNAEYNFLARENGSDRSLQRPNSEILSMSKREEQVWTALANLEIDSKFAAFVWRVVPLANTIKLHRSQGRYNKNSFSNPHYLPH
jgi:hypothetical protein